MKSLKVQIMRYGEIIKEYTNLSTKEAKKIFYECFNRENSACIIYLGEEKLKLCEVLKYFGKQDRRTDNIFIND